MKEIKNDSTSVLSRFGRDRRTRTVTATAERVERRPRLQREAADSEHPNHTEHAEHRASYNPHFTADNRPRFEKPHREHDERRREEGDRPHRTYGERTAHRDGERRGQGAYGDKPRYAGARTRQDEERPRRNYGDKPAYRAERDGEERAAKRYGADSRHGAEGRPYGEKRYGEKKYGGKPAFRKHAEAPANYPKYNPERQTGEIRLNRFIAQSGICSRREADDYITAGLVSVNGVIVTELGTKVKPTDEVKFNDSRVQGEKKVYLVLNKPKGYVTSLDDPHAGKTVMELVKGACTERIYPVGRLDKNSVGLLLFTNDGDLTRQLTHPSYKKKKIYQVTLDKPLTRADMDRIAEGITLEDGEIYADEISYVKENKQEVGIEIHSGRNRIVRRIFEFLGYNVTKLDRVYYAGLTKKNLKRGAWRFLTREEVERLKSGQYE